MVSMVLDNRHSVTGTPFQIAEPATEKARHCIIEICDQGQLRSSEVRRVERTVAPDVQDNAAKPR